MNKSKQREKIGDLLNQSKDIKDQETHTPINEGIMLPEYVSGPLFNQWLNDINIFSERYLTQHPLYSNIKEIYEYKNAKYSTFEDMVSIMQSVFNDDEYWLGTNDVSKYDITNTDNFSHKIFISHRSSDKKYVEIFIDFLIAIGVDSQSVFCSSLPGNDIEEKISNEIKTALQSSICNIIIFSQEYYESPYCLNESGIIWYLNEKVPIIPISLENFTYKDMNGFIDKNYKLRKLNNENDLSFIYDKLKNLSLITDSTLQNITRQINTLKERYNKLILNNNIETSKNIKFEELEYTTDDEKILIYYINTIKKIKLTKSEFQNWLYSCEIFNIDIDNAFDLISKIENNSLKDNQLELNIEFFKKVTNGNLDKKFQKAYECHKILTKDIFIKLIENKQLQDADLLFISYIRENNFTSFGDRWLAECEIENIKHWEDKNQLDNTLSTNYPTCLNLFIRNNLVYPSDFTSYGNPKMFTLYNSLLNYINSEEFNYSAILEKIKANHTNDLPF